MAKVKIETQLSKEDILKAVQQLSFSELEQLIQEIITVQEQRKTLILSKQENELLGKINQIIAVDIQQRYQLLIGKRLNETLTEDEYQELLQLTEQVEIHQANRLDYLAQLAKLRQTSLTNLITQIGIQPAINVSKQN